MSTFLADLPFPHPELLVPLALLAIGIVVALPARTRRGAVAGGTLLLAAIVAATLGAGASALDLLAVTGACVAAGGVLLLGSAKEEGR